MLKSRCVSYTTDNLLQTETKIDKCVKIVSVVFYENLSTMKRVLSQLSSQGRGWGNTNRNPGSTTSTCLLSFHLQRNKKFFAHILKGDIFDY